jgi:hypothetical protein
MRIVQSMATTEQQTQLVSIERSHKLPTAASVTHV